MFSLFYRRKYMEGTSYDFCFSFFFFFISYVILYTFYSVVAKWLEVEHIKQITLSSAIDDKFVENFSFIFFKQFF